MPKSSDPPCQAEACALQSCISKNTYSPEKCDNHLRGLYHCCQKMYEESKDAESTACPMPNVVHRWLKAHPEKTQSG